MNSKRLFFVALASLLFAVATPAVRAQDWYGGNFGGGGFGGYGGWWNQPAFGVAGSLYGSGYVPVPPYFSIHPPVYYSRQIIYRPMGDSPFAYLPRRQFAAAPAASPRYQESAEPQFTEPAMIVNPYVDSAAETTSVKTASATRSRPKLILNPFVGPQPKNSDTQVVRFQPHDPMN